MDGSDAIHKTYVPYSKIELLRDYKMHSTWTVLPPPPPPPPPPHTHTHTCYTGRQPHPDSAQTCGRSRSERTLLQRSQGWGGLSPHAASGTSPHAAMPPATGGRATAVTHECVFLYVEQLIKYQTVLLQIQCIPLLRAAAHLGVKVERDVACLFVPDQQRLFKIEVSHLLHPPRPLLKYFILITGSIHVCNHLCSLVVAIMYRIVGNFRGRKLSRIL